MKLWKFLTSHTVLKQLVFILVLFALLIPVAIWDSNAQVSVSFDAETVFVKCDRYNMRIQYSDIAAAELVALAEAGEPIADCRDDEIIRCGVWHNDAWGEYTIVADMDAATCVKLELHDGRILVFSRKNDKATAEDFETLQPYLQ